MNCISVNAARAPNVFCPLVGQAGTTRRLLGQNHSSKNILNIAAHESGEFALSKDSHNILFDLLPIKTGRHQQFQMGVQTNMY